MLKPVLCASIALTLIGCGSSSDSKGGGGAGGGPGIACEDPSPRVTQTPSFDPATIPAGQTTQVALTVPVTQSAYRVIIQMAQIQEPIGKAIGLGDQAYNDGTQCSVVVPLEFYNDLSAGKYFPQIDIELKPGDGGYFGFVNYNYVSFISKTNYALSTEVGNLHDSQIPIPFLTIQ